MVKIRFKIASIIVAACCSAPAIAAENAALNLVFSCRADNDLYRVLTESDRAYPRFDNPAEAVARAPEGAGLLVLADGYPQQRTTVDAAWFQAAMRKNLRFYVEYPNQVPGFVLKDRAYVATGPYGSVLERTVITSDAFRPRLDPMRILVINDCHYLPVTPRPEKVHLALARVAGYATAKLGLPPANAPMLFELTGLASATPAKEDARGLVATTKLSQFVSARYAPTEAWGPIWQTILQRLQPGRTVPALKWTPTVRPRYAQDAVLPADAGIEAIARAARWYRQSRLLVAKDWEPWDPNKNPGIQPLPAHWSVGDGSLGIAECYISKRVFQDGSQALQPAVRADCTAESAMGLALGAAVTRDASYWQHYWNWDGTDFSPHYQSYKWAVYLWLYDKTRFQPLLERTRTGIRLMMEAYPRGWSAECGRMEEERAHMLLPLAWLVRVEDTPEHRQWLETMARFIFDTLTPAGAIPQMVDVPYAANAQYGTGEAPIVYETGDPGTDLLYTMNFAFSGMHEAAAATGDRRYAQAAERMAGFLIRAQTQSEARPELSGTWFRAFDFGRWDYWGSDGDAGWGVWSTETGWTHSWITATLALRQMKTSLWEISKDRRLNPRFDEWRRKMLPDAALREPVVNRTDHAARGKPVQLAHPYHPAYSPDRGIEYSLLQRFWLVARREEGSVAAELHDPTSNNATSQKRCNPSGRSRFALGLRCSFGRVSLRIHSLTRASPQGKTALCKLCSIPRSGEYTAGGPGALTDGKRGGTNIPLSNRQGFEGVDLEATVDLGQVTTIRSLSTTYLQSAPMGIYLPAEVKYLVSRDGRQFDLVATLAGVAGDQKPGSWIRAFPAGLTNVSARQVRVQAKSIRTVPAGHPAAGSKVWLFVDEIAVNESAAEAAADLKPSGATEPTDQAGAVANDAGHNSTRKGKAEPTSTGSVAGSGQPYDEAYRPQFHFTYKQGWMSDINGLFHCAGEYHFFSQHNPAGPGLDYGNIHWGHAVSKDLIHWTELPPALAPDKDGPIFSGSSVVDWKNTSGLQTGNEPVIVAFYTAARYMLPAKADGVQSMAYSNDRGRTWTKHAGNPVLPAITHYNRDPKVFWHEPTSKWVMVITLSCADNWLLGREGDYRFGFFSSPDLKQWKEMSRFDMPRGLDCPDMFELPVDGKADNRRWVLWAGDGTHAIGAFDGTSFVPTDGIHLPLVTWDVNGANGYAAQTFSDMPASDGRRIQISWLRHGSYPGMPFNQQALFPCELTLRTTPEGIQLFRQPIREIELLHKASQRWQDQPLTGGGQAVGGSAGELLDVRAEIELGDLSTVELAARGIPITYDVRAQSLACQGTKVALAPVKGRIRLQVLVDRASIEVFANDGRVNLSFGCHPNPAERLVRVTAKGGTGRVLGLTAHELRSMWTGAEKAAEAPAGQSKAAATNTISLLRSPFVFGAGGVGSAMDAMAFFHRGLWHLFHMQTCTPEALRTGSAATCVNWEVRPVAIPGDGRHGQSVVDHRGHSTCSTPLQPDRPPRHQRQSR